VKTAVADRVAWLEYASFICKTWVRLTCATFVHAVEWEASCQRPCQCPAPNHPVELTASSVRSCVAPASGSSSPGAFWRTGSARPPERGAHFVRSLVRLRASRRRTRLLHLPRRPSSLRLAVPRAGERRVRRIWRNWLTAAALELEML
jgi:hypothetical protein